MKIRAKGCIVESMIYANFRKNLEAASVSRSPASMSSPTK
jgi:hypothetical protein